MQRELTPASERALEEAAHWARAPGDQVRHIQGSEDIGLPELLMGLLSQAECRAASMLAARGIDNVAVRRRWPELVRQDMPSSSLPGDLKSPVLLCSFQAVEERMFAYPRPFALATEHLLLGMLAVANEVSEWLAEHGFDADDLEATIHRIHGHSPEPLPYEPLDQTSADPSQATEFDVSTVAGAQTTAATSAAAGDRRSVDTSDAASEVPRHATDDDALPESPRGREALTSETRVYRILDASANRATEALRVVEDYVRFALDDRHLTNVCKQMRHRLADLLSRVGKQPRLASRDTRHDIGTELLAEGERTRADLVSVVAANCSRLQESLRSLEEYGKLLSPRFGEAFKQIRYESYTLQRAVETTRRSLKRLAGARLYVLVDGREGPGEFEQLVRSLVESGVHIIQLRDKRLGDRELLQRARLLRRVTDQSPTLFVMNDRADLAVLAGADGVHVGQDELPIKEIRSIVGSEPLIGVSTHSLDQARQAVLEGADYIGVGPAFASHTKEFDELVGVDLLKEVACEIGLPMFAIGGIDRSNLACVLGVGIDRVAISGAILGVKNPAAAALEFLEILARSQTAAAAPDAEEKHSQSVPRP